MAATATKGKGKQKGRSQEYDDANRGVLFVNDKDGNESRPDYTGKLTVKVGDYEEDNDGNITVRLAAWLNNSEKVGDYLAIQASPPQSRD